MKTFWMIAGFAVSIWFIYEGVNKFVEISHHRGAGWITYAVDKRGDFENEAYVSEEAFKRDGRELAVIGLVTGILGFAWLSHIALTNLKTQ